MAVTIRAYSKAQDGSKALSTNFKVREFACQDGSDPVFIAEKLVNILQAIRNHFGQPITINSGFRTASHNKKVGGAAQSQHLYGMAADIVVAGVSPQLVADYAEKLLPNYGGIGVYSWGVHIDVREKKSRWKG